MTPDAILSNPARVLTQEQREAYFENGYLLVEAAIGKDWLGRLRAAVAELTEQSRTVRDSDNKWNLEPGHGPQSPRLRRVANPVVHHKAFWEFAAESVLPEIVADLVGPDVKFIESQLNFKWAQGGAEIRWHQDIQFNPYTNYSQAGFGLFLEDVGPEQGPMGVIPKSHEGELYDLYDDRDEWVGFIRETDLTRIDLGRAVYLTGPAGSIQIHNCRTVHGSAANRSGRNRPILINHYCSADSFPYTSPALPSEFLGRIVRGRPARWAHVDPRSCRLPPDWVAIGGYKTIFAYQQGEAREQSADRGRPQRPLIMV